MCKGTELKKFSWSEVSQHCTREDAWVVVDSKVHDVSGWHEHPGGDVIFSGAGGDASDIWHMVHRQDTTKHLAHRCIGELDAASTTQWPSASPKPKEQLDYERAYRELILEMRRMGLFDASPLFYVYKMSTTLMIGVLAWLAIEAFSGRTWAHFGARVLAAVWIGIFLQQAAWIAHELCHNAICKNRKIGRYLAYFWGNFVQGFSATWWMGRHNTHHAAPNVHSTGHATGLDGRGDHNGDPDMYTMPLLARSYKMLQCAPISSELSQRWVPIQHLIYFPMMALARGVWIYTSFAWLRNTNPLAAREILKRPGELKPVPHEKLELWLLCLHFVWYFAIALRLPSWVEVFIYVVVTNASCGLSLACVFGLGHNAMTVYDANNKPDYWKLQLSTTRNISQDRFGFVRWFCGALDYQIEHHLFPTMPRHHLPKASELTKAFCAVHGLRYHELTWWQGTVEIISHLKDIAMEFVTEFPAM